MCNSANSITSRLLNPDEYSLVLMVIGPINCHSVYSFDFEPELGFTSYEKLVLVGYLLLHPIQKIVFHLIGSAK
jgi:hypothetical protein